MAYYHGCYVNYNNPELGKELIKVFNAMDIGVVLLEKEKCCGLPLMVNGFPQQATRQADFNIQQLEKVIEGQKLDVVGTSSSCTLTLKDEYEHILGRDNSKVKYHINLVTRYIYKLLESGEKPCH